MSNGRTLDFLKLRTLEAFGFFFNLGVDELDDVDVWDECSHHNMFLHLLLTMTMISAAGRLTTMPSRHPQYILAVSLMSIAVVPEVRG